MNIFAEHALIVAARTAANPDLDALWLRRLYARAVAERKPSVLLLSGRVGLAGKVSRIEGPPGTPRGLHVIEVTVEDLQRYLLRFDSVYPV